MILAFASENKETQVVLNQLAVSQLEVPRKRSGTGRIEIIKNAGSPQLDSERQRDSYKGLLPEERRIC
jgi:hypothetical protein